MVEEMTKFREHLSDIGVAWWDESDELIDRTKFEHRGTRWSVVNGIGTYGGVYWGTPGNLGLLEAYNFIDEPIGCLTAGDAVQLIFKESE